MATDDTRPLTSEPDLDEGTTPTAEHASTPAASAPTAGTPGPSAGGPARAAATGPTGPRTTEPYGGPVVHRRGPAPFAVFLGLLGLVVAVAVFVEEIADVSIPWRDLGPWSFVAGGLVVVLVGLLGLRGDRGDRGDG